MCKDGARNHEQDTALSDHAKQQLCVVNRLSERGKKNIAVSLGGKEMPKVLPIVFASQTESVQESLRNAWFWASRSLEGCRISVSVKGAL